MSIKKLDRGNWAEYTYIQLCNLIEGEANHKSYSVFDWDNTCVFMDTAENLLLYQIENLEFKLTPNELFNALQKNIPKNNFIARFNNTNGNEVNIDLITKDIVNDYEYLYNNCDLFKGHISIEKIRKTEEYKDFKSKLWYTYVAINDSHGTEYGYKCIMYLLGNMTSEQIKTLTQQSIDISIKTEIKKHLLTSSKNLPGAAGIISTEYTSGYRIIPEMVDLITKLMQNNIQVFICSASHEDIIKAIACTTKYGFNIPEENIVAMKLEKNTHGKVIDEYKKDYPLILKQGKAEAIKRFLISKFKCEPILIAGDSMGDYHMLTSFDSLKIGLIINRHSTGQMKDLYKLAVNSIGRENSKFVLQGRDENVGYFIPTEKTIKHGELSEKLFG